MNPEDDITAFYRAFAKGEPPAHLDDAVLRLARHSSSAARELGMLAAVAAMLVVAVVMSTPMSGSKPAAVTGLDVKQVRELLLTMKVQSAELPPGYSTNIDIHNFSGEAP